MTTPVGFVGLGNMGLPIAQHVLKAGYALHVFNRTAAKAEGLLAQGATWAPSPQVLAARTGLVLSIVADDDALQAVALGEHGILAGLPREGIHIDMSTVFPDTSQSLAQVYQERGAHFIASPVSGRPEQAAAAQLVIYQAGPAAILERCRPLFTALGQHIIRAGEEPHLANVLKLVTNFMAVAVTETLSEAFTWAEKTGLKSEPVLEMLQVNFPSWVYQLFARRITQFDFYSPRRERAALAQRRGPHAETGRASRHAAAAGRCRLPPPAGGTGPRTGRPRCGGVGDGRARVGGPRTGDALTQRHQGHQSGGRVRRGALIAGGVLGAVAKSVPNKSESRLTFGILRPFVVSHKTPRFFKTRWCQKPSLILLANLLQSSKSAFSWGSSPSFFAFQEGM